MRTAAAAALLALLAAPAARAFRPLTPPAPEFPADAAWVNSAPLPLSLLRGRRVSLVAFLNLSNLRSQRAARVLGRLWDRYALHGLMIIGVHSPDYEFDRDALQVRRTVRESGIKFPVVVDTRRELWNAYQNVGWPAFYLLSPKGLILTDRLGEGHYEGLERDILMALHEFNGYRVPGDRPTETDPPRERCGTATPSFYLGARRGVKVGKYSTKAEPIDERRDGEADVYGPWENGSEALRFTGDGAGLKS
ncbi:MAG: redoxin domain-containing protein, partial [Elusimicrobia bacterium]|nr:redoxin domain-containing protein [Elusimicrobiota bacterium]